MWIGTYRGIVFAGPHGFQNREFAGVGYASGKMLKITFLPDHHQFSISDNNGTFLYSEMPVGDNRELESNTVDLDFSCLLSSETVGQVQWFRIFWFSAFMGELIFGRRVEYYRELIFLISPIVHFVTQKIFIRFTGSFLLLMVSYSVGIKQQKTAR